MTIVIAIILSIFALTGFLLYLNKLAKDAIDIKTRDISILKMEMERFYDQSMKVLESQLEQISSLRQETEILATKVAILAKRLEKEQPEEADDCPRRINMG